MSGVRRYRKRPVTIEAVQFTGGVPSAAYIARWAQGQVQLERLPDAGKQLAAEAESS